MLHMRSKLYLGLKSTKFTSFLKGDGVGAIQDIVPSLKHKKEKASWAWRNDVFSPLTFPRLSGASGSTAGSPQWHSTPHVTVAQ